MGSDHDRSGSLTQTDVTVLAETFRLLGDPSRLRIVLCCLERPIAVSDIAQRLDLSVSLVSHHLRLLRAARLLKGVRQSRQIFYEVADEHISHMLQDMASHITEDHPAD